MNSETKFVICAPNGGFADNIKVISKCLNYAKKNNRVLVIHSSMGGLKRDFNEYFELIPSARNINFGLDAEFSNFINSASAFPAGIYGRINNIIPKGLWNEGRYIYIDELSGNELTFDFSKDYDETILYHFWYGQEIDFSCLQYLKFNDRTRAYIKESLEKLPQIYSAIHLRNTDKRVDYVSYINQIRKNIIHDCVLVCSDNYDTIQHIKKLLPDKNVVTSSMPPKTNGRPIHNHGTVSMFGLDQDELNLDMFCDLLSLSGAEDLYFPEESVMDGPNGRILTGGTKSGFSDLANFLLSNKLLKDQLINF